MVDSKAGTVVGDYSLSEFPPEREIADLTSRPDFFTKLVKLLTLAKCRSNKAFDDTRRSIDLIATGDVHGRSPVAVALDASKSTDTLRSSSESDAPVLALASPEEMHDPFERVIPERVARSPSVLRNRSKRERKYARRKDRPNKPPLSEPATTLTTIPEAVAAVEPNPRHTWSSHTSTEQLFTEDALMENDSSRARAAIALARAQLEHSRPASIYRKRERAANRLMMLPGEYEEYLAMQARTAPIEIATPDFSELFNPDTDTMRRTVQQSRSMVLTLMAAREAVSLRTAAKKSTHTGAGSISTIESQAPFPELYKPGDTPLCPPPSIPLPQVPPPAPVPSPPASLGRPRHSRASPRNSIYGGLPTEYDSNALRRVDMLIQDLPESRSEGVTSRKRSHSSTSSSSRCKIADMPDACLDYGANCLEQALVLPAWRPSHYSRAVIRSPSDGAPLTPAPTPPTSSPAPRLKSTTPRCEDPIETATGARREVKHGTQPGTPTRQTEKYFQLRTPPRPARPQSLVGPDPPKRLTEGEARKYVRRVRGTDNLLACSPGITRSKSSLQSLSVRTLTPKNSPQKPVPTSYRYI